MNTYKITIREFPDNRKGQRYSFETLGIVHGHYSLNEVLKIIRKTINSGSKHKTNLQ